MFVYIKAFTDYFKRFFLSINRSTVSIRARHTSTINSLTALQVETHRCSVNPSS
uniref:Uncharacterized protein n=1 Tax=Arion vulgaris TaxID=1028688 RepID=A0A0B6ZT02_9EUPU